MMKHGKSPVKAPIFIQSIGELGWDFFLMQAFLDYFISFYFILQLFKSQTSFRDAGSLSELRMLTGFMMSLNAAQERDITILAT